MNNEIDYKYEFERKSKAYDSLAGQTIDLHKKLDLGYAAQLRLAEQVKGLEQDMEQQKVIVRNTILQHAEERKTLEDEIMMLKKSLKNLEGVGNGDYGKLGH
jgi:hypothetical protein